MEIVTKGENAGVELAHALKNCGWQNSKSTERLMVIMSALTNIPWEKVKYFSLSWTLLGAELLPCLKLAMHEPEEEIELPEGMEMENEE